LTYNEFMRALLALILLTSTALASSFEDELARAHFLSGQSYFDDGRLDEALHEFREAYRISRRPGFQYNIAVCQEKLGRIDGAIEAFERYLREAPAAPDRATVEQRLAELRARPVLVAVPAARADRPAWRHAWFWGVVGGAAVVVVAGVTVGVVVGTRGEHGRTLPDVRPE
jgi:tetratricopeptide (TPR) repeat protein